MRAGVIVGTAAYLLWGLLTIYWHELDHFDAFELIGVRVIFSALTMAVALTVARSLAAPRPGVSATARCSPASRSPPCC